MIEVILYTRKNCSLCDEARLELLSLKDELPFSLTLVDIETNPKLEKQYGTAIPVVEVGPFTLKAPFSAQELKVTIGAALDRDRHIRMVEASPKIKEIQSAGVWTRSDALSRWFSNHYMLFLNLIVVLYLGGAFLAPIAMKLGYQTPAKVIYKGYGLLCHQLAYRSIFLFGDQWFYPRQQAGLSSLQTYSQASGFNEGSGAQDTLKARSFIGNQTMGYKVALCQRDVAIYGGILLFGILFSLAHFQIRPLHWLPWFLIGIGLIALDGFSQLLSQPPLSFWAFRESTPFLRFLTGFLFGFNTAWFGYPVLEESMGEMRALYDRKWKRSRSILE